MEKTIYYCDVCENEAERDSLYKVGMAIHKGLEKRTSVWLDTCENCLKETGYSPSEACYYNDQVIKKRYLKWFNWFSKKKN